MKVTITDFIDDDHRSHYWYGGECARIEYKGYVALIEAIGDVYAEYAPNGEYITHVKDKGNNGCFYSIIGYYIKSDKELYEAIRNENLIVDNNNWWECFLVDPQGNWHDLMWALDADYLDEAIEEVSANLDDVINDIKYTPSASNGDYSPSNPWDAPGMSIKDFI